MATIYGNSKIGEGSWIGENVIIGYPGKAEAEILRTGEYDKIAGSVIGENCTIRDFGVIYSNASLGKFINTGHHFIVREYTEIGYESLIGSGVIIEEHCKIGRQVSIQSGVYIPTNSVIEDNVFLGPRATLTNDKLMGRGDWKIEGITIKRGTRVGANSTILPGLVIGENVMIGAGAVVTKDVEPNVIVAGVPARKIGDVAESDRI
jgi:acetyltransferase-like isoleucine patch superfamily enzyme